jgi:hypothetical protein
LDTGVLVKDMPFLLIQSISVLTMPAFLDARCAILAKGLLIPSITNTILVIKREAP